MKTIRAAEARTNFAALLRRVSENKERIVIERRGYRLMKKRSADQLM